MVSSRLAHCLPMAVVLELSLQGCISLLRRKYALYYGVVSFDNIALD